MGDVAYFYPPPYQRAPAGSKDSLGSAPVNTGGGASAAPASVGGDGPPDETKVGPPGQLYIDRRNGDIYQAQA